MADRYWVGGTSTWNTTAGTKWALTSGGTGGQAVPTAADNVFFDAASGTVTVTISATANCLNLNCTGFTGNLAGTSILNISGDLTLFTGMTRTYTGDIFFLATSGSYTVTSAGKTLASPLTFGSGASTASWTLQDALTNSTTITIASGTFNTNNFNITASGMNISGVDIRTINLGSSTLTLSGLTTFTATQKLNLTFNTGTSTIICNGDNSTILNGTSALNLYNLSFTGTLASGSVSISNSGTVTVNDLNFNCPSLSGLKPISLGGNITVNGTLKFTPTSPINRLFLRSSTYATTRTISVNAFDASSGDVDFQDISITGTASPISGNRFGNCAGNSGITFTSKTVFYRGTGSGTWQSSWSFTSGGANDNTAFPLAQDTAVFPAATYPASGSTVTISTGYNIGSIDMSLRTSNTITLSITSAFSMYGNWTNGTGTIISGTSTVTFSGRNIQAITSVGKIFTNSFTIDSPSGTVLLADAFTSSRSANPVLLLSRGTFDLAGYSATLTGAVSGINISGSNIRTFSLGSGTFTIAGTGGFTATSTNMTFTGTGIISLTSASSKTFAGGGIQTYPTINQGGTGQLTISGSNKFTNITNSAIGTVLFTGGTTNEFGVFNLNGSAGNLLTLGSTNTTQSILKKLTAWNVGTGSLDNGNNTGLSFTAGGNDFLAISYINGQLSSINTGNMFLLF